MSLIVGIPVPAERESALGGLLDPQVTRVFWNPPARFFVLLKAIRAEEEPGDREMLLRALGRVSVEPFKISLRGVGRFPVEVKREPQTVFAAVADGAEAVEKLHKEVDYQLAGLGVRPDQRKYLARVNLGRCKSGADAQIKAWMEAKAGFEVEAWPVDHFVLYRVTHSLKGIKTEVEKVFSLVGVAEGKK